VPDEELHALVSDIYAARERDQGRPVDLESDVPSDKNLLKAHAVNDIACKAGLCSARATVHFK
jgi:hypothetical protein